MLSTTPTSLLGNPGFVDTTTQPFTFDHALQAIKNGVSPSQAAEQVLSSMTKAERLSLLDGDVPFWEGLRTILCDRYNKTPMVMGHVARLGIPGIRFTDGPRGVVMGASTAFPVAMARGATWDVELERRVGHAIGLEAKAQGANYFAGVCVNLPRHPAWGRIQETYGEDPLLLGEFGLALTQGVQTHVMACVKHFALNSMENARFRVDVKIDEDVLHEVYLPHFKRIIDGGVASVMSSYNSVNGEWAGQSQVLLTKILRQQYKFDGFVISDFVFGVRDAPLSLKNGLDIEAPFIQQRRMHLNEALRAGEISQSDVDQACLRILRKQLQFAVVTAASQPNLSVVFCNEHRALAREVAARSMVLLKNEKVGNELLLPLNASRIKKIAVIGRLANKPNTGDKGSSQVFSPEVVTPYEGLKAAFPFAEVLLEDSGSVERAEELAEHVDIVVCIVGYDASDEGEYLVPSLQSDPILLNVFPPAETAAEKEMLEIVQGKSKDGKSDDSLQVGGGGDRKSLRLPARDVDILTAVSVINSKTVASVISAGAVIMDQEMKKVPAVVLSWYAGSQGGHGLADVLLGKIDVSGRLPFSIPKSEDHLPFFDINASEICYDRWHGQHLLDKLDVEPAFAFGFGLSYTSFSIRRPHASVIEQSESINDLVVRVQVENNGTREGRYVAQVYGLTGEDDHPKRILLGFAPVDLAVGQVREVTVSASSRPLQRWINGQFVMPGKQILIEVAGFAGDPTAVRTEIFL